MLTLHDYLESGNGYKARLLLSLLKKPFRLVEYDIVKGETRTSDYLANINANGRIPVLQLEDGTCLAESNAILWYLADGTPYLPAAKLDRARVLQWMCFEQYSHEPNIATRRFWSHLGDLDELQKMQLQPKFDAGHAALGVMQGHLDGRDWFVGENATIADLALYAYTHVAHEGGFDLAPYPAIVAWLARVAALNGYVSIDKRNFD